MESLLEKVLTAHGGLQRWKELTKVEASIVSSGKFFDLQGVPQDSSQRELTVSLHEERSSLRPYGGPDKQTNFTPGRIAIETVDGMVLSERSGTAGELHHHMKGKAWDALDRAYFNGYAMWTYLTSPFFMAMPGFLVEEIVPWREGAETWRGLRVTFPPEIASHSTNQDLYFGEDFLLRRHDYYMDVAGEFYAAQYVHDFTEVAGIWLPTQRRAYKRNENGNPIMEELMVSIGFRNIHFS